MLGVRCVPVCWYSASSMDPTLLLHTLVLITPEQQYMLCDDIPVSSSGDCGSESRGEIPRSCRHRRYNLFFFLLFSGKEGTNMAVPLGAQIRSIECTSVAKNIYKTTTWSLQTKMLARYLRFQTSFHLRSMSPFKLGNLRVTNLSKMREKLEFRHEMKWHDMGQRKSFCREHHYDILRRGMG